MKILVALASLLLAVTASAAVVHPVVLPKDNDVSTLIYRDQNLMVSIFLGTDKIDSKNIHHVMVAMIYNPNRVTKVAADVGTVQVDCKNNSFQDETDFELDSTGKVIDERTETEMIGMSKIHPNSVADKVAQKICK